MNKKIWYQLKDTFNTCSFVQLSSGFPEPIKKLLLSLNYETFPEAYEITFNYLKQKK